MESPSADYVSPRCRSRGARRQKNREDRAAVGRGFRHDTSAVHGDELAGEVESEGLAASKAQIEELRPRLRVIQRQMSDLNADFLDGKMQLPELGELKNPLVEKKVELELN